MKKRLFLLISINFVLIPFFSFAQSEIYDPLIGPDIVYPGDTVEYNAFYDNLFEYVSWGYDRNCFQVLREYDPGGLGLAKIIKLIVIKNGPTQTNFIANIYNKKDHKLVGSGSKIVQIKWSPSYCKIIGSEIVRPSGEIYTFDENIPDDYNITWQVGPSLKINSGQNSRSCNIASTGISSSWIKATITGPNRTVSKHINVHAGAPNVVKIDGEDIIGGSIQYFFAHPTFSNSSFLQYEWRITKNGVNGNNIHTEYSNNILSYDFPRAQATYFIHCKIRDTRTGIVGLEKYHMIKVERGGILMLNEGENRFKIQDESDIDNKKITYELYNLNNGRLIQKGTLSSKGETLNLNNIIKGIYTIRLTKGKKIKTEKIIIK